MPSRNILRNDLDDVYYHVYLRGINKQPIFTDQSDKEYVLYLFARHLSKQPEIAKVNGYVYPHYKGLISLVSFCVMDNHVHLLIYQKEKGTLKEFMRSFSVSYTVYYNRKYDRRGPLFESRYKASMVDDDVYLLHISRYIHLNPRSWKRYGYSSYKFYKNGNEPEWLETEEVLKLYGADRKKYSRFVEDYEDNKKFIRNNGLEFKNL